MAWNSRLWLISTLMMALTACSTQSPKEDAATVLPDPSGKIANVQANPYLEQAGDAPAAAKQEFAKITAAMKVGRLADAERDLRKLHDTYPKLSGPLVNLGIINWKQKKYPEAEAFFNQAQVANKYNPDAYTQYAIMLREQGKFKEAEAQYLKAITVWPHNFDAHRDLGVLYDLYMGKFDLALQQYQLCDQLSAEPNKEIKGWILDLQRRTGKKAGD